MSSQPRTTIVDGRALGLDDVAPDLGRAMARFMAVAYPGEVDLVTRELVRIYSGRKSRCRICRNYRRRSAIEQGFDESMLDQIDDLESSTLEPRQIAALRLAQAFLGDPTSFDEDAQRALMSHFTTAQAAELLLDLVRLSPGSKLTVVSGDEPEEEELIYI